MTKAIEREEAKRLRKEEGKSIKKIAETLNVSKGTVSLWVRNIELTQKQKKRLEKNCGRGSYEARMRGGETRRKIHYEKRKKYQENGREFFKKNKDDILFISGVMMYWCEGTKQNNKNTVDFSNSDVCMIKIFLRFLKQFYDIKNDDISIYIHCYTTVNSVDIIEQYWSRELELPKSCFKKTRVNVVSKASKRKRPINSLPYGTCKVVVYRTDIIQSIYGAIQEFGNFERLEWLG
jgi:transcriptional regulator with XRE-family HTH domain